MFGQWFGLGWLIVANRKDLTDASWNTIFGVDQHGHCEFIFAKYKKKNIYI